MHWHELDEGPFRLESCGWIAVCKMAALGAQQPAGTVRHPKEGLGKNRGSPGEWRLDLNSQGGSRGTQTHRCAPRTRYDSRCGLRKPTCSRSGITSTIHCRISSW